MNKSRILRWGHCPGLSRWAQCNPRGRYKGVAGGSESEKEMRDRSRVWRDAGPQAKEDKEPLEAVRARTWILP